MAEWGGGDFDEVEQLWLLDAWVRRKQLEARVMANAIGEMLGGQRAADKATGKRMTTTGRIPLGEMMREIGCQ